MSAAVVPLSLKDAPALIERLLPVQRLSAESFEEQEGKQGKTLTTLGSYWKGRKPLVLNKACILGCLLPATSNPVRDLSIFEMLMGMDDESFVARSKRRPKPKEILEKLPIKNITDYFKVLPQGVLPPSAPIDWVKAEYSDVRVSWRDDLGENERRNLEARLLARGSYKDRARESWRPEEVEDTVYDHVWNDVNAHLGTAAHSIAELVEQLGIMRFGHVPRVADPFCGSGQIPFESARLGCETFAGDLNPVACMLTWGAFNIVGGTDSFRAELRQAQEETAVAVQRELDSLEIETDGAGWRPKTFLYCVEVTCPQTGWDVPLLPTRVISKARATIAELVPDPERKRYEIAIRSAVSDTELVAAEKGTVERDGRFGDAYLVHRVNGTYKTNISTLRGDYERPDGSFGNRVRPWSAEEFRPRPDDIFRERLYCIQWMRKKDRRNGYETEFRAINQNDLDRETLLETVVARNIADWQRNGWVPDMRIEPGGPPRYEGLSLIRGRGWTHWAHLFSPRQLMFLALTAKYIRARQDRFTAPL